MHKSSIKMLSRGMRKHIRREKARIRREAPNWTEGERRVRQLALQQLRVRTASGTTHA